MDSLLVILLALRAVMRSSLLCCSVADCFRLCLRHIRDGRAARTCAGPRDASELVVCGFQLVLGGECALLSGQDAFCYVVHTILLSASCVCLYCWSQPCMRRGCGTALCLIVLLSTASSTRPSRCCSTWPLPLWLLAAQKMRSSLPSARKTCRGPSGGNPLSVVSLTT